MNIKFSTIVLYIHEVQCHLLTLNLGNVSNTRMIANKIKPHKKHLTTLIILKTKKK